MFRYRNYSIVDNNLNYYSKQLKARGKKIIKQIRPRPLGNLSSDVKRKLTIITETWKVDTKLYKLAENHYGDPDLWWVIGYYNNKPIDASWNPGDIIEIPTPVRVLLDTLDL